MPTQRFAPRAAHAVLASCCLGLAAAVAVTLPAPARAQAIGGEPQAPEVAPSPAASEPTVPLGGLAGLFSSDRATLLGDFGGLRTTLGRAGISFGLETIDETFGNVTGGYRQGATANGLTMFSIGLDTSKAFGWDGGTFNLSTLWIYGPNFSNGYLGTLQTNSGILAAPSVRVWEAWYQQQFASGRMDVKIGQQSLDQEFMVSQGASVFLNTTMGWTAVPSFDLYAGGPAYPLSSLGVRLRAEPTDALTILAGVFDDNPPGGAFFNDSQVRGPERYGLGLDVGTGALFIAEAQYAVNPPPPPAPAGSAATPPSGLPGLYKAGAWFDTAKFPDASSYSPAAGGNVTSYHWHNYGLYAVADQTVWMPRADGPTALSVFGRPVFAPSDRNFLDFCAVAGVLLRAPLPTRENDTFGVAFGYANVSNRVNSIAPSGPAFSGAYTPLRSGETLIEVTYQAQFAPWLTVQPDFQYYWMPGGGIANPNVPNTRVGNEALFGIRTTILF